jgi:S1-C subfamily serine protease
LHFFTGAHEDYHRPSDDIEKVNFEGAARVGELALSVLDDIDEPATVLSYVKTEKKTSSRGGFKVSLGTMPDYAADVDGLMLDGVRGGGAAEKAGLKKGDLIVKIGERNIHGIDDFMASFAVMEPGKGIVFVVVRDGKQEEIEVIPSAPRPH